MAGWRSSLAPCTALAVVKMLESVLLGVPSAGEGGTAPTGPLLRGKVAVVVGAGEDRKSVV